MAMTPDPTPAASEAVLLPCPFCGATKNIKPEGTVNSRHVVCLTCNAMGPCRWGEPDNTVAAVAAWNTRPPAAPADLAARLALADRLKKLAKDIHPTPWNGDDEEAERINDAEGGIVATFSGVCTEWLASSSLLCEIANNLPEIIAALAASAAGADVRECEDREAVEKAAYMRGWHDREDDLILGVRRIMPKTSAADVRAFEADTKTGADDDK